MKQILYIGIFLLLRPPWCHSTVIHDILQPVKDSPKFEDTNGMDGYMAWLFNDDESNEIHVPVKSLDEDISITLPFALRTIFRMEEIESCLFAILGPNGESKLELTLSQSGPELININLHSESLPNKQVSFPESDILENWVDILFVVKENEIILKMNCSSPEYVEFDEKIQQIDITDGAELHLGYSGKVERNPFKGAVQEIKIYSGIDDKEIEELCTKEISLPASGGVRGEALPKPENLQGFLECPPPLIPPPPNGDNSCNCSASFVAQILQNMPELKGSPGDKGPPGADGNPGSPGITGKPGHMGERGPPGLQGDRGEKGDNGTPGVDGATGPKGEPGKEGPQGPLGPPGLPGEACKEKEVGKPITIAREKGDTGPIGPPGTPGLKGQDGEKGEKGSIGIKGEKGDQGHTGAEGLRGEKGDRGEAGIDGLPGLPGAHGRPAEKGDKGERGEQGLIGEPGRPARLSQLLDPDMDPKEVQDIIEKLRGYKGDTGQSGAKGEKGDQGPHGPHGHHGKDGKPGVQGERGPPGESGPQGPIYHIQQTKEETNVIPEKGSKGESGKQGARGPTGHTGKRGPKGSSGIKGAKGDTGNTGPKGPIGPPGMKGEIGEKGECIIPDTDKFKGEKGAMGPPGVEGKPSQASCDLCSGIPGPPGPQGLPGRPGLSIVGPKGEPGGATPSKIQNNIDDDEDDWYKSDTVIYKNTKSLFKRSATIPLGTLAYVIREKILLMRVETGWQYVVMGSIMEYRDPNRDLFTTTISSQPVMSSPHYTTTVEPIAAIREPTLAKVARSDQRVIHIAALNAPYDGKMLSETNNTFYNGANYDCQQQAQRYHFGDTYEVFLANQHQDLRDAVISSDHNLPVVNIKEQVLFKSWKSMFDGSGALFSIESGADIYSFSGRNVLLDPIWPKKAVWHGGSSSGHVSRNCNGWQTNSRDHSGVASDLNESKLLGEKKYTCDSSLVVLCVQTIGTLPRRNERPRTVYRRQRHPIARRRKYESHRHNQLV